MASARADRHTSSERRTSPSDLPKRWLRHHTENLKVVGPNRLKGRCSGCFADIYLSFRYVSDRKQGNGTYATCPECGHEFRVCTRGYRRKSLTPEQIKAYDSGEKTIAQISVEANISEPAVSRYLREAGIEVRARARRKIPPELQQMSAKAQQRRAQARLKVATDLIDEGVSREEAATAAGYPNLSGFYRALNRQRKRGLVWGAPNHNSDRHAAALTRIKEAITRIDAGEDKTEVALSLGYAKWQYLYRAIHRMRTKGYL